MNYSEMLKDAFGTTIEDLQTYSSFDPGWLYKVVDDQYDGAPFDTALPQAFFDECLRLTGVNPVGLLVWGYPPCAKMFGMPLPVRAEGWLLLKLMGCLMDCMAETGRR